jgi:AraC-like DNA-binding protein
MSQKFVEDVATVPAVPWVKVDSFAEFAAIQDRRPATSLSTWCPIVSPFRDAKTFSVAYRSAAIGSVTVHEANFGGAVRMSSDGCQHYHVSFRIPEPAAPLESNPLPGAPLGDGTVHRPDGTEGVPRWIGHKLDVMIDRDAVDAALSDALGRPVRPQIEFTPTMRADTGAARSWMNMASVLSQQLFTPDSVLHSPGVGLPFADSLVHGLLVAADHPHRAELAAGAADAAPAAIRRAIDVIEAEAERPLTVSEIATRCHVSARSLQLGFRQHLGTTPMAYLRAVRLRRAHEELLESDPSVDMVARIAYRWGFTNTGRFAAAHAARYGESPAVTLRRTPSDVRRGRSRPFAMGRTLAG